MYIKVQDYMNDGANWQAQMVRAYIKGHYTSAIRESYLKNIGEYLIPIQIGRYENCREQGYVFTICFAGKQRNYAVYEHRNSDRLCVLISNTLTLNTPNIDDMWADKGENPSKYDYDVDFDCGAAKECGDYILDDIALTINEWLINKEIV